MMGGSTVLALLIVGVILAVIGPQAYRIFQFKGYHKAAVKNVHPGECWNIPGIEEGSEDIEPIGDDRILVTSGLKWPVEHPINPDTRGRVLLMDLNQQKPVPEEVTIKGDLDLSNFNPAGLTKWVNDESGKMTIMIVNLIGSPQLAVVERFVYSEAVNTLYHVETLGLGDKNFYFVDDIVAVGERKFYFTNILGKYPEMELNFMLPWQTVGLYDGSHTSIVDDAAAGPNGINMSPDGKYVYVAMFLYGLVRTYKRNSDDTLEIIQDFQLPFYPDNVMVAESGDVWVTGPLIGYKCFEYLNNPINRNPVQVMRLETKDGMVTSSSTVFVDDGELMSGGSVALPYGDRIFIGSVRTKASICNLENQ